MSNLTAKKQRYQNLSSVRDNIEHNNNNNGNNNNNYNTERLKKHFGKEPNEHGQKLTWWSSI